METVVGAIAIAFVLWWLAEEFQQIARRNRALEFVQWWRRRGANLLSLLSLRELQRLPVDLNQDGFRRAG